MKVWVDSEKPNEKFDHWAKNSFEVLKLLDTGKVKFISMPLELNSGDFNALFLADEIKFLAMEHKIKPIDWEIRGDNNIEMKTRVENILQEANRLLSHKQKSSSRPRIKLPITPLFIGITIVGFASYLILAINLGTINAVSIIILCACLYLYFRS